MQKLAVIIPCYNEARTLRQVVNAVVESGFAEEILLVDDGSADETREYIERLQGSSSALIKGFFHAANAGKGAAIKTALKSATADIVLVQDADLEYSPEDYGVLIAPFDDSRVQVVYGSRNLRNNPRSSDTYYWGGRLLSFITNILYGSRITDEATGYKVVRTGLLRELQLKADGFDFCPELTGKLLRRGVRIHEVPISYRPRSRAEGKKIRVSDGWRAVHVLVRERFRRITA